LAWNHADTPGGNSRFGFGAAARTAMLVPLVAVLILSANFTLGIM
jgi:hypothetical protein